MKPKQLKMKSLVSSATVKTTFRPSYTQLLRFHFVRYKVNVDSYSLEWGECEVISYLSLHKVFD